VFASLGPLSASSVKYHWRDFESLQAQVFCLPLQIPEKFLPTLVWKRYGHLYPGSTREAIAALDRHFEALDG
jgi:hypothetical protein